jgi:hypothetical protein
LATLDRPLGVAGVEGETTYTRIELVWPFKDRPVHPVQGADGVWTLAEPPEERTVRPLLDFEFFGEGEEPAGSLVITGNRLDVLRTLARGRGRSLAFAYLDMPRIEVDDKAAAFRGDTTYVYSTWLTVLREHLREVEGLLKRDGVVAIHVGDTEEPLARLVADEVMERDNRVGTVVWQRSYAPRNMKGMTEFTATHDCILLYAQDRDFVDAVGFREAPAGFSNPDDDPRGPWSAMHKGAHSRRAKSDFNTYVPPYRWRIVDGRLPDGVWRLSPLTGVIWGRPTELGEFPLTVEVEDSSGSTAKRQFVLHVRDAGSTPEPPTIPWVFSEIQTEGPLRVVTENLPPATLDTQYSAVCLAEGGEPFRDEPKRPGSGRYWEFADDTLMSAYQHDMVDLGRKGDAIPRIKKYADDAGEEVVRNQQTWWPAKDKKGGVFVGFTQDATKHLKKLREIGVLKEVVVTAKPEPLLARLLAIFSRPGDTVLEVFGDVADLAAVSIKSNRHFIYLAGESDRSLELLSRCAIPRLEGVIEGRDRDLEQVPGEIKVKDESYVPYDGGGSFAKTTLGEWVLARRPSEEFPRLNTEAYPDEQAAAAAVLSAEGFIPVADDLVDGARADGTVAMIIPPDEYLTSQRAAESASKLAEKFKRAVVLYFMADEDFDPGLRPEGITFRRVPSEVVVE